MGKLTRKQRAALAELALYDLSGGCAAHDMAFTLFGESYGIFASRARGRLRALKRLGCAENYSNGLWRITPAGLSALEASQ